MKDFRKEIRQSATYEAALRKTFENGKNRGREIKIGDYVFIYDNNVNNMGRVIEESTGYALPLFSFCFDRFFWLA